MSAGASAGVSAGASARASARVSARVGSGVGAAMGPALSESSVQSCHEIFAALGSREVLAALYGEARNPANGIRCPTSLAELLAAADEWLGHSRASST